MNKNIIVNLSMFVLEQDVYYYENGDCVEKRKVSVNDLSNTIEQLRKKYQVRKISIAGPADYAAEVGKEISTTFDNCAVEIIPR